MLQLTAEQATAIVDAHEIDQLLKNDEEVALLRANNPTLLEAYISLLAISVSGD